MDAGARRPLKTRSATWARKLAAVLAGAGISPNVISAGSMVAALLGGLAFLGAAWGWVPWWLGWLTGAVMIQLRLVCNLMDGMVAVEWGRKSPTGDLWNEIPDRFADTMILAAAGWAAGAPWTGALAAWAALMTAYVRTQGAALTGRHDFCGPLAKPQRMAVLTLAALLTAVEPMVFAGVGPPRLMPWALLAVTVGTVLTVFRRIRRIAGELKGGG